MLDTLATVSVGPNVSSRTAGESSGTFTRIVGLTYGPFTESGPPRTALPPLAERGVDVPP
jgi:hypothetical protein